MSPGSRRPVVLARGLLLSVARNHARYDCPQETAGGGKIQRVFVKNRSGLSQERRRNENYWIEVFRTRPLFVAHLATTWKLSMIRERIPIQRSLSGDPSWWVRLAGAESNRNNSEVETKSQQSGMRPLGTEIGGSPESPRYYLDARAMRSCTN